jgi:hypothetical protein
MSSDVVRTVSGGDYEDETSMPGAVSGSAFWGDCDEDFDSEPFVTPADQKIFDDVDVLPEPERSRYAHMQMGAIDRRRPLLRVAAQRVRRSMVTIPISRWRPRARAHRYRRHRVRRRVARTCGSRGDPPDADPDLDPLVARAVA